MTALSLPTASRTGSSLWRPLGIVAILLLWEGAARLLAGSYILAGPIAILGYLLDNAGLMSRALLVTLEAAAWGFVWGNLAGT